MQTRLVDPKALKNHPLAHLVPDMRPSEWEDFYNDVAARGIKVPLEVLGDGTVVDGRHRLKAALRLCFPEVPIIDAVLGQDDAETYMLKAAVLRRHLTDDQRACIAALWYQDHKKQPVAGPGRGHKKDKTVPPRSGTVSRQKHRTEAEATSTFKVSRRKLEKAQKVRKTDPELFAAVHRGDSTLNKAHLRQCGTWQDLSNWEKELRSNHG